MAREPLLGVCVQSRYSLQDLGYVLEKREPETQLGAVAGVPQGDLGSGQGDEWRGQVPLAFELLFEGRSHPLRAGLRPRPQPGSLECTQVKGEHGPCARPPTEPVAGPHAVRQVTRHTRLTLQWQPVSGTELGVSAERWGPEPPRQACGPMSASAKPLPSGRCPEAYNIKD